MRQIFWLGLVGFLTLVELGCGGAAKQQAVAGPPATVAEGIKALNLAEYPLPEGIEPLARRGTAQLFFKAVGKTRPIFEAQRKYLLDRGWKEEPNAFVSDESANTTLTKDGFTVSLSALANGDHVAVTVVNHGNVNLGQLPTPPAAKRLYAGPVTAIFVTELGAEEAHETCHKLLEEKGWQPYGEAGDARFYKQNAIRLTANISSAPAQGGKTTIQYSAELMSADLPALPEATAISFTDNPARLTLETGKTAEEIAAFYREALAKQGFKATTENLIHSDAKDELIFRNPEKDLIWLTIAPGEQRHKVEISHDTAAEVEAKERRLREKLEKKKELRAEED